MMVSLIPYTEGQPGFRLQEEELREEACCWFLVFQGCLDLTVPSSSPPAFKYMPYREFLFGGWGSGAGGTWVISKKKYPVNGVFLSRRPDVCKNQIVGRNLRIVAH